MSVLAPLEPGVFVFPMIINLLSSALILKVNRSYVEKRNHDPTSFVALSKSMCLGINCVWWHAYQLDKT